MGWREPIEEAKATGRDLDPFLRRTLGHWETCLVGEQVSRGLIPADWWNTWHDQSSERFNQIHDLGVSSESMTPEELSDLLDQIEDEALALKRSSV